MKENYNTGRKFVSAVILAAGEGSRFGRENGTKQNISVGGIPAVVRAALAFEKCSVIDEIILVGRREELSVLEGYKEKYGILKITYIVAGGSTRAESSCAGVSYTDSRSDFVAIHDGARCMVTPEIIENTVFEAFEHGAAAAAEKVVDTVKKSDGDGYIESTVDREYIWLVKTPQVFKTDAYKRCMMLFADSMDSATDDCMMAEKFGIKIKLCDCGKKNIKLTTRDDLELCEFYLLQRERNGESK